MTRVYIPLTASGLRSLVAHGAVQGAPFPAHAVTPAVRASERTAGQDDWEYAALNDAVRTSGTLLTAGERRRIVAAADVPEDAVGSAPGDSVVESAVMISDSVALKRIASFHVDGDTSQDDDVLWYDVTELPVLLDLL